MDKQYKVKCGSNSWVERGEQVKPNSTRDNTIPWNWNNNLIQVRRLFQTELELVFLIQFLIPNPRRIYQTEGIGIRNKTNNKVNKNINNFLSAS